MFGGGWAGGVRAGGGRDVGRGWGGGVGVGGGKRTAANPDCLRLRHKTMPVTHPDWYDCHD